MQNFRCLARKLWICSPTLIFFYFGPSTRFAVKQKVKFMQNFRSARRRMLYNIKEATKTIRENRKRKQELKQEYEALNEQCDHLLARLRKLKSDFTKFKSEVMETMILF